MTKNQTISGLALLALTTVHWFMALFVVPVDVNQGESYRIIYIHVPAAFAAFFCAGILLFASVRALGKTSHAALPLARAATEVGLIFTIITLATGSIWGRPTWGTWWTWDARLTTTLLLGLLFAGWILLFTSLPEGPSRTKGCSILGIMIAADVPIIYKSVTWWRTLHQPQTILRPGGSASMDPEMLRVLLGGCILMLIVVLWLVWQRRQNIQLQDELDQKSLAGA